MPVPRTPQDHKPAQEALEAQEAPDQFPFTGKDGKDYTLPLASDAREALSGRDVRNAMLGGETAQAELMFKMVEAVATPAALDALYDRPQSETMDVLKAWGEYGDGDGVSLGESSRSSA